MVGYDFNGVVDTDRPGLRPTIEDVIITGNTHVKGVLDWLQERSIQCAVYFLPDRQADRNRYAAAVWKSEMIRRLRLDKFYEDDQLTCDIIRASCPECEVVRIT